MHKLAAALIVSCSILAMCTSTINATNESPSEVFKWVQNLGLAEKMLTKLHFYFHRISDKTAAVVAVANMTSSWPTRFGAVLVKDDPMTVGPELSSKRIGYAQGITASASLEDVLLFEPFNFVFTDGTFNGSTLAVLGSNGILHKYRELPVVGGTGVFRLAQGLVTYQTYFYNATSFNAVVEVDLVASHYG